MITDRTQTDVDRAIYLLKKGWAKLSTSERDEWASGMKGFYNYTDYNRVGAAVALLAGILNGYGYSVTVIAKTDWNQSDEPNETLRAAYLNDIAALKTAFYGKQDIPSEFTRPTPEMANSLELLLLEIEAYINQMIQGFRKCGTFKCGQGVILP